MKANAPSLSGNYVLLGGLGILASLLVWAVLSSREIPLISGDRAAFFTLLIIGFAMCSFGALSNIQPNEWLHPMNLIGITLGSLAVLLGVAVLTGIELPLVSGDRAAFITLAIIISSKVVLARMHHTLLDRLV